MGHGVLNPKLYVGLLSLNSPDVICYSTVWSGSHGIACCDPNLMEALGFGICSFLIELFLLVRHGDYWISRIACVPESCARSIFPTGY